MSISKSVLGRDGIRCIMLLLTMLVGWGCDSSSSDPMTVDASSLDSQFDALAGDARVEDARITDSTVEPDGQAGDASDTGHSGPDLGQDSGMSDAGQACPEPEETPDCTDVVFLECEARSGTNGATLLVGTVVNPTTVLCNGQVLLDGESGLIACVGSDCTEHPLAAEATVVCADIVAPGMIDPHNHMSFNTLPPWRHGERLFQNRDEWRPLISRELYGARPNNGDPVAARYNELRLLMAGTTAVHKADNVTASHDHVRNLDRGPNAHGLGYGEAAVEECVFPLTEGCNDAPDYTAMRQIPDRSYLAHVSEGVDTRSREEFDRFVSEGQLGPETTIIHCVSCEGPELSAVRAAGAKLVWSPQSNIDLYGGTMDVPTALNMGIPVALGPDWTASGTMNQLAEMKCAQRVSAEYFGGRITDQDIFRMVTDRAADAVGVADLIGHIGEGMHGDVITLRGDRRQPYSSVVALTAQNVAGVFIGSRGYYGDPTTLSEANRRNNLCEPIEVCGVEKIICVRDRDEEANPTDPGSWPAFGFNEVVSYVQRVVQRRRPDELPAWLEYVYEAFPLFECNPTFSCRLGNAAVSGFIQASDNDGDDTENAEDNCPDIFNPSQSDLDGDGFGDACDPCPWSVEECPCNPPTGVDLDADGLRDEMDNCPRHSNPDQADQDSDGYGDVCDMCPDLADGPMAGCPTSIPAVKRRQVSMEQFLTLEGVVTAVLPEFAPATQDGSFFMQTLPADDADDVGYSGMFVYLGNRAPGTRIPEVGHHVRITGMASDFYGQMQLTRVQALEDLGAIESPLPHDTSVLALTDRPDPYESLLVCVEEVTVTDLAPPRGPGDGPTGENGEFVVTNLETGASIRVNDGLYRVTPFPELGTMYARVCGVHRLANGDYKIEPRDALDLDSGPPRVIALGPAETAVRQGVEQIPQTPAGAQLRVELNVPAPPEGVVVQLSTPAPDVLTVAAELLIPEGATDGLVSVLGQQVNEGVTLNASTAAQAAEFSSLIQIYPANTAPTSLTFGSDEYFVVRGEETTVRLQLDAPSVDVLAVSFNEESRAGLTYPADVRFPAEQQLLDVVIRGDALGDYELIGSQGALTARTLIRVIDAPRLPVINEIDADMAGVESREFVEIYNAGVLPVPLAGWSLELMNGSNGMPYKTIPLDSVAEALPPLSYLVVGDDAMAENLAPNVLFIPFGSRGNEHDIQNGNPDGVQLLNGDVVVDAMSYAGVIENVTEGNLGAPDDANDDTGRSLSRCANGEDTDDNANDFSLRPGTPGTANDCPEPPMPDGGVEMDAGLVDGGVPQDMMVADADLDARPEDAAVPADAALDAGDPVDMGIDAARDSGETDSAMDADHDQGPADIGPPDAQLDRGVLVDGHLQDGAADEDLGADAGEAP